MKLYSFIISSFPFYTKLKTKQTRIENVLESKGIQFELIDISAGDDDTKAAVREEMRKGPGPTAMPPQLYNGTEYCGVSEQPGTGPRFNGLSLGGSKPMRGSRGGDRGSSPSWKIML